MRRPRRSSSRGASCSSGSRPCRASRRPPSPRICRSRGAALRSSTPPKGTRPSTPCRGRAPTSIGSRPSSSPPWAYRSSTAEPSSHQSSGPAARRSSSARRSCSGSGRASTRSAGASSLVRRIRRRRGSPSSVSRRRSSTAVCPTTPLRIRTSISRTWNVRCTPPYCGPTSIRVRRSAAYGRPSASSANRRSSTTLRPCGTSSASGPRSRDSRAG